LWIQGDGAFDGYLNILSEAGEGWEGKRPRFTCGRRMYESTTERLRSSMQHLRKTSRRSASYCESRMPQDVTAFPPMPLFVPIVLSILRAIC
jgi:hypothetical protein